MPIESIEKEVLNNRLEQPEQQSILDRIVSERMSDEEKKELTDTLSERLEKQDIEDLKEGEVEKTPRQIELILEANRLIAKALRGLGVKQKIEATLNMVHIVRPSVFEKYVSKHGVKGRLVTALASVDDQAIVIKAEDLDELMFLNKLIHEILHLNSFVSLQVVESTKDDPEITGVITERRMGLRVKEIKRENKKNFTDRTLFNDLDEAVIEKMTIDIIRNFRVNLSPELAIDFEKSEKLRKILIEHIQNVVKAKGNEISEGEMLELGNLYAVLHWQTVLLPEASGFLERYEKSADSLILEQAISFYAEEVLKGRIRQFSYSPQRIILENLIHHILKKNKSKFNSSTEVAKIFLKGLFEGRMLPLARLIEDIFGKGSFRRLGEGEDITNFFAEKS